MLQSTRQKTHQVGSLTSGVKGKTVAVVCAMYAAANFVPPFYIFSRKIIKPFLMDRRPAGSFGICKQLVE